MKPLPMPLRLAAGLVATAIEEAQELPRKLVELPVTAVSQVLQASMRMQQRVTELAIKGDQALGGLRPVPETPTWARFDEDEIDPPYGGGSGPFGGGSGSFGGGTGHPFGSVDRPYGGSNGVTGASSDTDWNVPPPRSAPRTVSPIRIARDPEPGAPDDFADDYDEFEDLEFRSKPSTSKPASAKPATAKPPTKPPSKPSASKPAAKPSGANGSSAASSSGSASKSGKTTAKTGKPAAKGTRSAKPSEPAAVENGPKGHEDYPTWTLPQLRGRFRSLELADVQALLTWETSHLDRPPYVTMLSNRIASITGR